MNKLDYEIEQQYKFIDSASTKLIEAEAYLKGLQAAKNLVVTDRVIPHWIKTEIKVHTYQPDMNGTMVQFYIDQKMWEVLAGQKVLITVTQPIEKEG